MENRVEQGTKKETKRNGRGKTFVARSRSRTALTASVTDDRLLLQRTISIVIFAGAMERLDESVRVAFVTTRVPSLIFYVELRGNGMERN